MDNQFDIDLADIAAALRAHEVVAVRFLSVGQRLLLDFRASELDGPMVRLVEPVKSLEERYRTLRQLRPRFSPPERVVAIWWPRYARSLETTGIWDVVMRRVIESGHAESVRDAAETLVEILALERKIERDAITGQGFKTLWAASPTQA